MSNKKEIKRNRPSKNRRDSDRGSIDDVALQPGISTISGSNSDAVNDSLTETAANEFPETKFGTNADKTFDEVAQDNGE